MMVSTAHIKKHVWMVMGCAGAAAHELFHADLNRADACIILEMWNGVICHEPKPFGLVFSFATLLKEVTQVASKNPERTGFEFR